MEVFRCLPLILLLLLPRAMCTDDGTEVIGVAGRSVTFHLQNPNREEIVWNFHGDTTVLVRPGDPPNVKFFDKSYEQRLTFSDTGSALTISQLTTDDAGTYTATMPGVRTTFTLRVYRELTAPTVTCTANNCSADRCNYTLRCATPGSGLGDVSYIWFMGGLPWVEGPTVLVEETSPDEKEPLFTCAAHNPVSSSNVTVPSLAALCAENTTRPPVAGTHSSRQVGIVASVIAAVVLFVAVLVGIFYKRKGWKIFRVPTAKATDTAAEAEYTTVYAQVGPSQQVNVQNISKVQRDDSKNTSTASKETARTIYSRIQAVAQTDDEKIGNGTPEEKTLYASVGQPANSGTSMGLL